MGNDLYMLGESFLISLILKIILSEIGIIQQWDGNEVVGDAVDGETGFAGGFVIAEQTI